MKLNIRTCPKTRDILCHCECWWADETCCMCGAGQWAIKDAAGRVSSDRFGSREDAEEGARGLDTIMPHASPHVAICMKEGA